ncbi:MAG TPA: LysE family transporter [Dongiaceae bacterium]|jgi:threonine/homoserine/homoserine lactone efflux protein|nr:LysE family transporter [Dongiaceae bacterium]
MSILEAHPVLLAALTGFFAGFLVSIPVGPINLTIINEGSRQGFRWAALIAFGAISMELIYCTIAFTGLASFFEKGLIKAAMELVSFVFLLYLGMKFLTVRHVETPGKIEERLEQKLHPHSAFMTGFVRVMGNPGVLLFWIVLAAYLMSREWVDDTGGARYACIGGVAAGATLWFLSLSYAVSCRKKSFSEKTLIRLEQFSGIALLVLAIIHGGSIIREMVRHGHHRF